MTPATQGGMGTAPIYTAFSDCIVVDGVALVRQGYSEPGMGLFAVRSVRQGDRIAFVGGKDGEHSIHHHSTAERILAHWEGYCENNGLTLREGTIVEFVAANVWRKAPVVVAPTRTSTTVRVGAFRYGHGGMAAERRISKRKVRVVKQPAR